MEILAAGFGNILLDLILRNYDETLLQKYFSELNEVKEIGPQELEALVATIKNYNIIYSPGGCAQNTMRLLQWILDKDGKTAIFGAIGNDSYGLKLKSMVEKSPIYAGYYCKQNVMTGIMVSFISGHLRSIIGNIGASDSFNLANLEEVLNLDTLKSAQLIYIEGFFLTNRMILAEHIINYSKINKKILVFNLCAVYMSENFPKHMYRVADACDILCGNKAEYEALALKTHTTSDIEKLVASLKRTYNNSTIKHDKIFIITNAEQPIKVYSGNLCLTMNVPIIDVEHILDTTGAGDAFLAGFLGGYLKNYTLEHCTKWGLWLADKCIREIGCNLPNINPNLLRDMDDS